ncbi:MAG: nicotinate phosphoribosyltransferase [Candidatus Ornithospirochaeta sp.]|nr:nicotinate phosphoribosyltransferase [Candidatus Ornithospirochaeta sp.]
MKSALITDFYELTMMQGYFLQDHNPRVVFDMFYRNNPFQGGYTIFTGIEELIDKLEGLAFSSDDIDYLKSLGVFDERFIEYLRTYRFRGDVYAFDEGTPAFPGEPLIRIETRLMDAQLIESLLLNTVNFQTLIATKASRMVLATKGHGAIMEFGLRRAQGEDGAHSAARASFIGGTKVTSDTYAGKIYGIPVAGTMAHSWIMSFDSEEEAFRRFSEIYPDNCILLIDTYDTLGSGIEAAITIGKEMKAKGKRIGVRIDSGDLSYLTKAIRARLDEAGLEDATICISNDLTEEIILNLINDGAPIDSWGIGTHLVTGGTQSSLNGVYKLSAKEEMGVFVPTLKVSNSYEKTTNPGIKQVYRFFDKEGSPMADLIALADETPEKGRNITFYHPFSTADFFVMKKGSYSYFTPMLSKKMEDGRRISASPSLQEIQKSSAEKLARFDKSYKRQINPHIYKVSLSENLRSMKTRLIMETREKEKKL